MKRLNLLFLCFIQFSVLAQNNQYKQIAKQNDILFETGKFDLAEQDLVKLDSTIKILNTDKSFQILLTSHTDSDGSQKSNMELSKKRSSSVKAYLMKMGVSEPAIHIFDYGESKPITNNKDEESKKRNRSVTVEVVKYIPLVKINGKIRNNSGAIPNAKIFLNSSIYKDSAISGNDGSYEINAIENLPARLSVVAKNNFTSSKIIKIKNDKNNLLDFELSESFKGSVNKFDELFFYGDEARMLPTSLPSLKDLLLFMNMNPTYKIEIMGHVNYPGTELVKPDSRYFILSVNRAKTIRDYLVNHQIESERIIYKGYGNSKMKFPHPKSEAETEANRRVDIKILEN
ncbi:MAG: OmpA family protein [Saprospiraceae bacterium]|nr:OmpA family protein [Saprospiraceae bacterium]